MVRARYWYYCRDQEDREMKKNAAPGQIAKIVEKLANGRIQRANYLASSSKGGSRWTAIRHYSTNVYLESDLLKRPKEVLTNWDRKGLIPARKVDIDADPDTKGLYDIGRFLECYWTSKKAYISHPVLCRQHERYPHPPRRAHPQGARMSAPASARFSTRGLGCEAFTHLSQLFL